MLQAWNVVNCFADNTTSRDKPDLVATGKGERAIRGTARRFLWDWICPSRMEYREYCTQIIQDLAKENVAGIQLDSVTTPCLSACLASAYADCVVLSTYETKIAQDLQREMVHDNAVWRFFEERDCSQMLDVLTRWQSVV